MVAAAPASSARAAVPAPSLLPGAKRRLLSDLKRLQDEPVPLANAGPCAESDLTLWNGVIGCEMHITHLGLVTVPLHFLIDFPQDYPNSAPNIGFSFEFQYTGGASYTQREGRLEGKKVICLDVLGNFGHVHTEWKSSVGSGWSPAYTVSTLLVQLQSVLCNLGENQSQRERDVTYQTAVRFCEQNPSAVLRIFDAEELRDRQESLRREKKLRDICRGDDGLVERIGSFARKSGVFAKDDQMDMLLELLSEVASAGGGAAGSLQASAAGSGGAAAAVDTNICCWSTGKLYTEALLGVGLSREKRNLATAAELLSREAFVGGLRQNTDKSRFEFFLPVWVNEAHASSRKEWRKVLLDSCTEIGRQAYQVHDEDGAILEVFPRLVNQMVLEMMKPEASKSEAIALFEALCNFWRTFRWLVDERPKLRERVGKMLSDFVKYEEARLKDKSPDIGALLVCYTVLQGYPSCPARQDFIDAFSDECSLRWVMWWKRSGTPPSSRPVFEATAVSREILMFQMMVVDLVIGDVPQTIREMEATNCKLPTRLQALQSQWRERKQSIRDWAAYFECIGAAKPRFRSLDAWIDDCALRAGQRGPKYGGAQPDFRRDNRKGKGTGKGK